MADLDFALFLYTLALVIAGLLVGFMAGVIWSEEDK